MSRRLAIVLLLAAPACRSAAPAAAPATPAPPRAAAPATTPEAIRWARTSAEHRASFLQVYATATARVEAEAATHAPGTWGVVLDADETVIDNSTYQLEQARL